MTEAAVSFQQTVEQRRGSAIVQKRTIDNTSVI
jgi:hypothetical protein